VSAADLKFQRTIDLPPIIVWDALVDAELLAGWLGDVQRISLESPRVRITWPGADARQSTLGTVTVFDAPRRLRIETDNRGTIECTLTNLAGGLRGSHTELGLRIDAGIEPAFASTIRDEWETNLDRLELLLKGQPADWTAIDVRSSGRAVRSTSDRSVNSPD